jgi:hypothetical protein
MTEDPSQAAADCTSTGSDDRSAGGDMLRITESRPASYDGTCLRPLGLCELGGSCEVCWYRPDHPRFRPGS